MNLKNRIVLIIDNLEELQYISFQGGRELIKKIIINLEKND